MNYGIIFTIQSKHNFMPSSARREQGVYAPEHENLASVEDQNASKELAKMQKKQEKEQTANYDKFAEASVAQLSPEDPDRKKILQMFSEPSVKQEVLKRAMQMIEKNPNALNAIVQELLENKDVISAKINEQKKSIRSLKGEKAYWTGQLNKLPMTSEIGTKIKQIGRNIRALERQIRNVEKTPFDIESKLIDGTTISSLEVLHAPASNRDDDEEFDAGSMDIKDATPVPLSEMRGTPTILATDELSDSVSNNVFETINEMPTTSELKAAKVTDEEQDVDSSKQTAIEKTKLSKPSLSTSRVESITLQEAAIARVAARRENQTNHAREMDTIAPPDIAGAGMQPSKGQERVDMPVITPDMLANPEAAENEQARLFKEYLSTLTDEEHGRQWINRDESGYEAWLKQRKAVNNPTDASQRRVEMPVVTPDMLADQSDQQPPTSENNVREMPIIKSSYEAPLIQRDANVERTQFLERKANVGGVKLEVYRTDGQYVIELSDGTKVDVGDNKEFAEEMFNFAMVQAGVPELRNPSKLAEVLDFYVEKEQNTKNDVREMPIIQPISRFGDMPKFGEWIAGGEKPGAKELSIEEHTQKIMDEKAEAGKPFSFIDAQNQARAEGLGDLKRELGIDRPKDEMVAPELPLPGSESWNQPGADQMTQNTEFSRQIDTIASETSTIDLAREIGDPMHTAETIAFNKAIFNGLSAENRLSNGLPATWEEVTNPKIGFLSRLTGGKNRTRKDLLDKINKLQGQFVTTGKEGARTVSNAADTARTRTEKAYQDKGPQGLV
jgi:hypothetical protein